MKVAGLLVAACAYQPSTYHYAGEPFAGHYARAGCLDLAFARRADLDGHAVVAYRFGNRCDEPALVDLTLAVANAVPYDPDHVIEARDLDARAVGAETLAYASSPEELCVDPVSIAHAPGDGLLCLGAP